MAFMKPAVLYSDLLADLEESVPTLSHLTKLDWPPPDATYREFASMQLLKTFYKKFVDSVDSEADRRAFDKFCDVNERCRTWKLPQLGEWDTMIVNEVKRFIYDFWYRSGFALVNSLDDILDHSEFGPGASVGAVGKDFYTKAFSSPLTTTSPILYHAYEHYFANHTSYAHAESLRRTEFGEYDLVAGSRFHFVPKQNDISRLICVEPSLNGFFQLGFGNVLRKRLWSYYKIDLSTQPDINRELARRGSLDGSFSTIDLSSASDSMSLQMLEFLLPPDFLRWMKLLRSPLGLLNKSDVRDGETLVEFHMVSSMGNGYTFPLQTLVFSSIVAACMSLRDLAPRGAIASPLFSVFGDDIVCPELVTRDVLRCLSALGFEVNAAKTFVEGSFRESCGYDYLNGRNTRGVYLKRLHTNQDRYVAINLLNRWSAKTGIPLRRTVGRLVSCVRYQPVPFAENDDAGVKIPSGLLGDMRRDRDTSSIMYRRSVSRPTRIVFSEDSERIKLPFGAKPRIFNPDGLWISMLRGSVKSGVIHIRHGMNHYSAKWGVTPYWDYFPAGSDIASEFDWQRWETAVWFNFMS